MVLLEKTTKRPKKPQTTWNLNFLWNIFSCFNWVSDDFRDFAEILWIFVGILNVVKFPHLIRIN